MYILGCHFGHDSNITLTSDGNILGYYEKERHVRVRHAMGLTSNEILGFIKKFGLSLNDIDIVAITSTQACPILDWDGMLHIALKEPYQVGLQVKNGGDWINNLPADFPYRRFVSWSKEMPKSGFLFSEDFGASNYKNPTENTIISNTENAAGKPTHPGCQKDFHYQEIDFSLCNQSPKRAYFVSHHFAHALYAQAFSPYPHSLIVTMDGATANGYIGGGVYFGTDMNVSPVFCHGFWGGSFYDTVSWNLGSGMEAGKMMGLAAYGEPIYAESGFVGPIWEISDVISGKEGYLVADHWLKSLPKSILPDREIVWNPYTIFPPENLCDIAASAQQIFKNNVEHVVKSAIAFAKSENFSYEAIVLSGGCALNCPTNSLLFAKYGNTFVPPAINDEGLSIGAALLFDRQWIRPKTNTPKNAYLGFKYPEQDAQAAIRENHKKIIVLSSGNEAICQLAEELANGKTAGFFYGAAEIGPRALGHRSILASPLDVDHVLRVNNIKNREPWRPFAPIATEKDWGNHFYHCPDDSYFMLFNARLSTRYLPAITHVDGTARLQIATDDCGPVYNLLEEFGKRTGYEVLLNTSFNGKGEPIVETPNDAIDAFLRMDLDVLFLDGTLIKKLA